MKWKIGNVEIKNQVVFAPMAGVSNISYRQIIKEMGVGLIYSEMISTMGIVYNGKKTIDLINFSENERPISIQIFGSDLKSFVEAAKYIEENFHPDIIDINMGCPVPKVAIKSQAGSALLKDPDKIYEIVKAVVDNTNTPITVKIRSGWDDKHINAVEVAQKIESAGASAIAIHARTRSQGYSGSANWNIIKEVKQSVKIPVIGNGDITSPELAKQMLNETGCDAIMVGRATLGNPWIIKEIVHYLDTNELLPKPTKIERIEMIKTHYNLLKKYSNTTHALLEIRTHALWYLKGIPGTKEIKAKICQAKTEEEFMNIIKELNVLVK